MIFVTITVMSDSLARLNSGRPPVRGAHVEQEGAAARRRYRRALMALTRSGLPFLVGGAYALEHYTTIARWTKDLDIFVRPGDVDGCLDALTSAGFETEIAFPHWLAKAYAGRDFIDLIFSSGNGVAEVDDEWMAHATPGLVLGLPVPLCPAEEMIWSKAFVAERERYDGADIAHLIRAVPRRGSTGSAWSDASARTGACCSAICCSSSSCILPSRRQRRATGRSRARPATRGGRERARGERAHLPGPPPVPLPVPPRHRRMGIWGRAAATRTGA